MADLESWIEQSVCAWAEDHGFLARKLTYIGRNGCPDRLFVGHGHVLFVEFKRPGARPEPHQTREHMRFEDRGVTVHVIDNIEDGIERLRFCVNNPVAP